MRDVKFRVWNSKRQTMENKSALAFDKTGVVLYDYEQLMQYTGLKDKNNVEIYEGDIVRVIDDVGYYGIGKIIFNLCSFCFEWIDDIESNIEPMITVKKINLNQELEVIGNIYENKELLK